MADLSRPNRSAGVLLHPTSLPGPYGIGDLGPAAFSFIDALAHARQKWWQILPLGPTGYGDSPYQSFSAFGGNPYLVSPELMAEEGLIARQDLEGASFPEDHVEYGNVIAFKLHLTERAWNNFKAGKAPRLKAAYDAFQARHQVWLDDYGLFMAIKDSQAGKSWVDWPDKLRRRDDASMRQARKELAERIDLHTFRQFLFFRQWHSVREYAHSRNVRIMGDIPIFVSADSADVWANPQFFHLDENRRPKVVAGVPPDYFSATGQLWGNPLYNWDALKKANHSWWVDRFRQMIDMVDMVRLDHFRGFEAYWEVPAGMPTAQVGKWVKAPGADLLRTLQRELQGLPIIAEDLGLITPEVEQLRDDFRLPGMRILQFAFGGEVEHRFLPHNYDANTVAYTGTHDNDTTWGWWHGITEQERDFTRRYLGRDGSDVVWDLIRLVWASVADWALVPLQDVLNLGPEARMNMPGRPAGNWGWRYQSSQLHPWTLDRLGELTHLYGRG